MSACHIPGWTEHHQWRASNHPWCFHFQSKDSPKQNANFSCHCDILSNTLQTQKVYSMIHLCYTQRNYTDERKNNPKSANKDQTISELNSKLIHSSDQRRTRFQKNRERNGSFLTCDNGGPEILGRSRDNFREIKEEGLSRSKWNRIRSDGGARVRWQWCSRTRRRWRQRRERELEEGRGVREWERERENKEVIKFPSEVSLRSFPQIWSTIFKFCNYNRRLIFTR